MTAVNDANIALTKLVVSAIQPLQTQIDKQEEHMNVLESELEKHRKALVQHEGERRRLRQWITNLMRQLQNEGIEPYAAPEGLTPE